MDVKQQTIQCIDDCLHKYNQVIVDINPTLQAFRALITDPNMDKETTIADLQKYIRDTRKQIYEYDNVNTCHNCGNTQENKLYSIRALEGQEGATDGSIDVCQSCYNYYN